jgi:hypothetical protein
VIEAKPSGISETIASSSIYRGAVGAELNAEIEHQTARDTIIGPEKHSGRAVQSWLMRGMALKRSLNDLAAGKKPSFVSARVN